VRSAEAFRQLQNFLATLARHITPFYPCHISLPFP
jgi:hypothetical protein